MDFEESLIRIKDDYYEDVYNLKKQKKICKRRLYYLNSKNKK